MKKFLAAAAVLLIIAASAYAAVFQSSVPIGIFRNDEVEKPFRAYGEIIKGPDGKEFTVRSVEISSFIPGHHFSEYSATEEDYYSWMELIGEMGANTVQVANVMDADFYNALYRYEISHETPLYLIQGVDVADDLKTYDLKYRSEMIYAGKTAVDVVHGHRDIWSGTVTGNGSYRRDLSDYVVGFLITGDIEPDDISYVDHRITFEKSYEGRLISSRDGAMEAMLARMMDEISCYESDKYNEMRPVGFVITPSTDMLEYKEVYARQLGKYASIDPAKISASADGAGFFVAFRMSGLQDGFIEYLSDETAAGIAGVLQRADTSAVFDGYIDVMRGCLRMPLLAICSASSSRGVLTEDEPAVTEKEQGEYLALVSRSIEQGGWSGMTVASFTDVWTRRTWNTSYATMVDNTYMWHDIQSSNTCTGLADFETASFFTDGIRREWEDQEPVAESGGYRLYARYDNEGLYLMIEGVTEEDDIYIPIDICSAVGAKRAEGLTVEFDRAADFLLRIHGRDDTRLLVQQRYDANREKFLYETTGENPFIDIPPADSASFVPVEMTVDNSTLVDEISYRTAKQTYETTVETGLLRHGTANPEATFFDSLADFCFGDGFVEVRLPWLMINVGDPCNMQAHRDYYLGYGVDFSRIKEIWLGVGQRFETVSMAPLSVKGWNADISYGLRLKQSYYVLADSWKEDRE